MAVNKAYVQDIIWVYKICKNNLFNQKYMYLLQHQR